MYIITFYSFKGGVGRTMALVNTGAELARRGRKVLLVDFDLEAPGLSTYDLLRSDEPKPGIVEFVTEFRDTWHSPLVTDFIYEPQKIKKKLAKKGGQLWVMPAGRGDADYRRKLNALNWMKLYKEEDGFLLFEDAKAQWEAELHPDYVLIDARTGHTDIEGICTRQLADAVVVVFHPNEQNLAGLTEVCRSIRAEATSGLKKTIKLQFVASNVPHLDDEHDILRRQLGAFRRELSIPPSQQVIIHRKETLGMLEQPVFVLNRPRSRLAREYRRLVRSLIVHNLADRDGALLFLRQRHSRLQRRPDPDEEPSQVRPTIFHRSIRDSQQSAPDTRRGLGSKNQDVRSIIDFLESLPILRLDLQYRQYGRMLDTVTHNFWDDAEMLIEVADYLHALGRPDLALRRFERVLQLQPDQPDVLLKRAECRQEQGDRAGAAEDLLRYLRVPRVSLSLEVDYEEIFVRLLDVSLDKFLEAISSPSLRRFRIVCDPISQLVFVASILVQERRWDDAFRYLETTANDRIRELEDQKSAKAAFAQSWRAFYLAMAVWGKAGRLLPDLCQQALVQLLPPGKSENSEDLFATDFQCLSLMWWGVGDSDKALALLDRMIEKLEKDDESGADLESYWTFRPTTPREFRFDCDEMRRMIRGEPVRPAFLGEFALSVEPKQGR